MKDYSGRKDYSCSQETPPYADISRLRARIAELEKKLEPMPGNIAMQMAARWFNTTDSSYDLIRRVEAWHEQR